MELLTKIKKIYNQRNESVKFECLKHTDLCKFSKIDIDAIINNNDHIISDFLPDEVKSFISLEVHERIEKKLLFSPFQKEVFFDLNEEVTEKNIVFFLDNESMLERKSSSISQYLPKVFEKQQEFSLLELDSNTTDVDIESNVRSATRIIVLSTNIHYITIIHILALHYNKPVLFLSKPSFSPFRNFLLGLPPLPILKYNEQESIRKLFNRIINDNSQVQKHIIPNETLSLLTSGNVQDYISLHTSKIYKSAYKTIFIESNIPKELWISNSDQREIESSLKHFDLENSKSSRKSLFNAFLNLDSEKYISSSIREELILYITRETSCWNRKLHIAKIIYYCPNILKSLCVPNDLLNLDLSSSNRSNAIECCLDNLFIFTDKDDRNDIILDDWILMNSLDLREGIQNKKLNYIKPTLASLKEGSLESISKHTTSLNAVYCAKLLAANARWHKKQNVSQAARKIQSEKISMTQLTSFVHNQLMTPFTSWFIFDKILFLNESQSWIDLICLDEVNLHKLSPRSSLLVAMHKIASKDLNVETLVELINNVKSHTPYALDTIIYGLWWYGYKNEIKQLKSKFTPIFSDLLSTSNIHTKIIFALADFIKIDFNLLELFNEAPPAKIPDNFLHWFNTAMIAKKLGKEEVSSSFFTIAENLNKDAFDKIFDQIPS